MPTALIVEDEPEANKLLGMLLKLRGYQAASAFNGAEAFEHLRDHEPDVVFLDLMLPDLNGYEVCRAVKTSKTTCLIPLVIVSARLASENRIESFHAGADDFIPKPYMPDQIFLALKHAEAFREQSSHTVIKGSASLADPSDDDSLRDLAHLRSLILGRTPLSEESADRIHQMLDEARSMIVRWTEANPGAPPVSLRYELSPERLVLSFHDQLGWLDESMRTSNTSFTGALERFDKVAVDRDKSFMTLVKKWA